MQIFCTLFDSNYLSRGVACYDSLFESVEDFHLYIFAFDDLTHHVLRDLELPKVTVISLAEFENKDLLAVKQGRSRGEYCWTCTPFTVDFVLKRYNHSHCTYIDADLFYYKNPGVLLDSMGENSVLITPHFYTSKYNQEATSGIFCVQHVVFKNDTRGRLVLDWWKSACLEWCYARFEDGKFGDQKYLDCWPEKFQGIYISENIGEGVAPWNIQQWKEQSMNEIIFYHFHALSLHKNFAFLGYYEFPFWVRSKIYRQYINRIKTIDRKLLKYKNYKTCFRGMGLKIFIRYCYEWLKMKKNFLIMRRVSL